MLLSHSDVYKLFIWQTKGEIDPAFCRIKVQVILPMFSLLQAMLLDNNL